MAWRMNRNNSLSAKNLEYPVFTHNWFLPAVLITVIYTVLLRYWWDVSGGYDDELLPLEALSRVVPALALLCLFPFLQKHVRQTLPLAERRKLQMVTLGNLLLFCQESDWMTFIREPYLVGRVLFALFILGAWLALFITFATGPQDLLPSAHHSHKIWTLLFAMGCLIASQAIDLIFDASIYGYRPVIIRYRVFVTKSSQRIFNIPLSSRTLKTMIEHSRPRNIFTFYWRKKTKYGITITRLV